MNSDEKDKFYKAGWEARGNHNCPSPETKKFMSTINMEIKYIKEKLEKMPTKAEMDLANEKLMERWFTKADSKYAAKLTERILYGIIGVGGSLIVVWILNAVR